MLPFAATAQQPADYPGAPAAAQRSRPYQRVEWFISQRSYPFGYIPSGVRQDALTQLDQMIANEARAATTSAARGLSLANGAAGTASGSAWTPMGPQPTSNVFETTPVSGRITSVAVDPTNANTIYIAGAQGGVWKTTDGGANWTPITDDQVTLSTGSIALDPDNAQNVWVGTGEGEFGADNYYGAGILKSADGGASWTQVGQSTFAGAINSIPPNIGGAHINSLAVLKGSGNLVAIAGVYWFQQSTAFTPHSGVYRTANGGSTWTNVLSAAAGNVVAWDPNNASNCGASCIAYATIGDPFGDTTNGFYRSLDSGQTWTKITTNLPSANVGRIAMGLAKNNTGAAIKTTIYLGIGNGATFDLLGMWKSTDGGTSWSQLGSAPNYCPSQCFYDNVIGVVPTNDGIVFAGGAFGDGVNPNSRVWRSIDGGSSWAEISKPAGNFFPAVHADIHAFAFSPDNATLYVGTDGGIYRSSNAPNSGVAASGITWANLNGSATDVTKSLALTQFYPGMATTGANYVIGGTQDNGTQLFTGNIVWNQVGCGDGGWSAIDPGNSNILYTACNNIDVEKSTANALNGQSFNQAQNGIDTNDVSRTAFIPPLVMDPSNSQVLYFGTFKAYQTTNAAASWTAMAGGLDLTGGTGHINAISAGPSNTLWVGTSNAKVKVSTNANLGASASFTDRTTGLPNRAITQIMPDFADSTGGTAYVTFSGFDQFAAGGGDGQGYVYKTTNFGANWSNITGNLPHSPANDIVVDPSIANTLYVATDVGVFSTSNGGASWSTLVSGLPKVAVLSLKLHNTSRTLVAGTHGRSAWRVIVGSLATALPSSISFLAQGFGSTSSPQFVTVTNTGSATVTVNTISITNNAAEFAVVTPVAASRVSRTPICANSMILSGGATCLIGVTFAPAAAGTRTGTLTIANSGSSPNLTVSLTGTGPAAGTMSLQPNPVAFGNLIVNSSATLPVTLSNSTGSAVSVGSFTLPSGFSQTNNCPASLNNSAGCTVFVTFKPTGQTSFSGNLSVLDSAAGSPHLAAVSGAGVDQTESLTRPNTVSGTPGPPPTTITISTPGRPVRSSVNTVIAGSAATVPILFAPAGATGTASLSCFGAPLGASCDVQPSTLKLNGASARAAVVVRYSDSPDSSPPGSYQVQVLARTDSFSSVLALPLELVARVATAPSASAKRAAVTTVPKSSDEPAPSAFELSTRRLEFTPEDRKPDSAAREVTLTNLRSTPLQVSIDTDTDFSQTNDCDKELAGGATCHISVRVKSAQPSPGALRIITGAGTATVELRPLDRSRLRPED